MDTKSDEKLLAIETTIESNKQENYEKLTEITEDIQKLTTLIMNQANISKSSPYQKNTLSQIGITLPTPGISMYTLP